MNFIANETSRKLRGGYYTDPDIVAFLLQWVLETQPAAILEPSCGDGAFLRGLARLPNNAPQVQAFELDPLEAAAAREVARSAGVQAQVVAGDFLQWLLAHAGAEPAFDAVVGNPPFIRYQYLDGALQDRAQRLITTLGLPFTKHTNAWVPFVVGSLAQLRPGGRLAMVVPAELLHVLHAQSVRRYLLRECARIVVLDPEELWFAGALQGTVLLLAEKAKVSQPRRGLAQVAVSRIRGRADLAEPASLHIARASFVPGEQLPGKWMLALLTVHERELLATLARHQDVHAFSEVASVAVGIVTGANKFFLVPDSTVAEFDLQAFAHPMFGRSEHVPGVLYDDATHRENQRLGLPSNFLWFNPSETTPLSPRVQAYVQAGEAQDLHKRYKCRSRDPWYRVPSVFSAPVGMLKRSHDFPRLVLNRAAALTTDTAYRIVPKAVPAPQLVLGFVNSLTALTAELEGRHYGGGVLELVPSEIRRLLVPVVPSDEAALQRLDHALRAHWAPAAVFELQDAAVLGALGLPEADRCTVRNAWYKLRNRRQRVEQPLAGDSGEDATSGDADAAEEGTLAALGELHARAGSSSVRHATSGVTTAASTAQ